MPYTIIALELTDQQRADIARAIGPSQSFGLLAQPFISGQNAGKLMVYILTAEQYGLLAAATNEGYRLPAFTKVGA